MPSKSSEYKQQILREDNFTFEGVSYSPKVVIEKLGPLLTPQRISRLDSVIENRTFHIATVIENLYDTGNISAVMRSAESFGFLPFHIIERADAKYKKSERISRGTEKWLDIRKTIGPEATFANLKAGGYKIYATDLNATIKIEDIDFSQKVAVVLGNEKDGISDYIKENADGLFKVPMYGFAQSFNISVAAALCFYHIHKFRTDKLGQSGDLTDKEKLNLKAHYILRTLENPEKILLNL